MFSLSCFGSICVIYRMFIQWKYIKDDVFKSETNDVLDLFENGFFLANIVGHAFGSVGNAIVFLIYESWNPKKFIDNDNISNLENNYIINEVKIDNDNINIEVNIESSRLNLDFDKILKNVRKLVTSGSDRRCYWERPYTQWKVSSWDDFYLEKYPNASKRKSHDSLGSELDALIKNLKPKTKNHNKVLLLKRNLEGRRASRHRASATCTFAMRKKLKSEKNNGKEEESKKKRKAVEELKKEETLWCLVDGDTLSSAFPVDIEPNKIIGHLKDSVRRKIGAPDNVKVKDIELWRVNVPFEEFKENSILLNNIEVKEKLFPTVKISSVFDDEISELKFHFIVKVPANIEGYILPELESNDIISKRQKLLNEKDENVKEICKMPCPSTSASPVFEEKAVPIILWEYKNEIGTGGKDPSIQGGCGYANSCCPSIILAIAGPWICVLGAVYLENPVIEPLTDFILMMNRPEDDGKRVEELAVFFESLRLAFRTLDNYYKGLKELDEAEAEKIQRFFPYQPTNLAWKAETDEGKFVIVKFTKKNNHHLLDEKVLFVDGESSKESFPPVPISGQLSLKTVLSVSSTSSSMEPLSVAIDVGWIPSKNDVKDETKYSQRVFMIKEWFKKLEENRDELEIINERRVKKSDKLTDIRGSHIFKNIAGKDTYYIITSSNIYNLFQNLPS
ncbi:hypothetical protein RhiirA4_475159 [Rhizophagus irregularis]|uniref:Crinkler effector protein N-terminal domain-containing protein n=1 Tax=Rhizophagus irregularis TaxID=588596 RepID=A0A2I1H9Q5_9GLOM|nr:hypothetical protein RhiirA4_475159 [Rhizophagus irregularis]